METKEKITRIIYGTLECLLKGLETGEDLDLLINSIKDYEKEGYPLTEFKKKYQGHINELKERLYNWNENFNSLNIKCFSINWLQ